MDAIEFGFTSSDEKRIALLDAEAKSTHAESMVNIALSRHSRVNTEASGKLLDEARDAAKEASEFLKQMQDARINPDLSGVVRGLSDSLGNFAPNVEVAKAGGVGVEASNSTQDGNVAQTRQEAGTLVGGAGGSNENLGVEIPENYKELTWPELRSLASNFDTSVRSKDEAYAAIEKELELRRLREEGVTGSENTGTRPGAQD